MDDLRQIFDITQLASNSTEGIDILHYTEELELEVLDTGPEGPEVEG